MRESLPAWLVLSSLVLLGCWWQSQPAGWRFPLLCSCLLSLAVTLSTAQQWSSKDGDSGDVFKQRPLCCDPQLCLLSSERFWCPFVPFSSSESQACLRLCNAKGVPHALELQTSPQLSHHSQARALPMHLHAGSARKHNPSEGAVAHSSACPHGGASVAPLAEPRGSDTPERTPPTLATSCPVGPPSPSSSPHEEPSQPHATQEALLPGPCGDTSQSAPLSHGERSLHLGAPPPPRCPLHPAAPGDPF